MTKIEENTKKIIFFDDHQVLFEFGKENGSTCFSDMFLEVFENLRGWNFEFYCYFKNNEGNRVIKKYFGTAETNHYKEEKLSENSMEDIVNSIYKKYNDVNYFENNPHYFFIDYAWDESPMNTDGENGKGADYLIKKIDEMKIAKFINIYSATIPGAAKLYYEKHKNEISSHSGCCQFNRDDFYEAERLFKSAFKDIKLKN